MSVKSPFIKPIEDIAKWIREHKRELTVLLRPTHKITIPKPVRYVLFSAGLTHPFVACFDYVNEKTLKVRFTKQSDDYLHCRNVTHKEHAWEVRVPSIIVSKLYTAHGINDDMLTFHHVAVRVTFKPTNPPFEWELHIEVSKWL